jgi:hypothetical protein
MRQFGSGEHMVSSTKRDKRCWADFACLLDDAFRWLAANDKLGESGRHEAAFAQLCGSQVRNIRRWRDALNRPNKDSWETAKNGLRRAGLDPTKLEDLCMAWSGVNKEVVLPSSHDTAVCSSTSSRPFEIVPQNPFPKLCIVNLDVPEQSSTPSDFIVTGELRFARTPDVVDGIPVIVGIRRAVLLPVSRNCYCKPGSLHRQPSSGAEADEGAARSVFHANGDSSEAVLEGDQLKGQTLARFLATGDPAVDSPEVDILLQLEAATDLSVVFRSQLRGRSWAQKKLAENWIARQLTRTLQEPDGSLRIGACIVRWRRGT